MKNKTLIISTLSIGLILGFLTAIFLIRPVDAGISDYQEPISYTRREQPHYCPSFCESVEVLRCNTWTEQGCKLVLSDKSICE